MHADNGRWWNDRLCTAGQQDLWPDLQTLPNICPEKIVKPDAGQKHLSASYMDFVLSDFASDVIILPSLASLMEKNIHAGKQKD